ncbi:MAG: polysaccharide pyruvyl transferase family protein [Phyllobacterium sp.]
MHPYHWESDHGNFGDDLNLWLWDFLLPGMRDVHEDVLLVGVGTVLNSELLPRETKKLVIGSGVGYGVVPDVSNRNEWDIRCVRGPLTAEKLGLDKRLGIVDPAVMVTEMPEFRNLPKKHKAIFIPHWESAIGGIWNAVCDTVGLTYIDPCGEAKSVIRAIAQSELVVAESMHAAIFADAFRVPWISVSTSNNINNFKWQDWGKTVGVEYRPRHVPVSTRAEAVAKGGKFWGVSFENNKAAPGHPPHNTGYNTGSGSVQAPELTHDRDKLAGFSLKHLAKRVLATPSVLALWQASKAEPQLSPDGAVEARKEQFIEAIADVRRSYF